MPVQPLPPPCPVKSETAFCLRCSLVLLEHSCKNFWGLHHTPMGYHLGAENPMVLFSFQALSFQVKEGYKQVPSLDSFALIISVQNTRVPLSGI